MKTHLLLITLFLNISLFAQQNKTSSTDVFVKIKDDFEFDLSSYSNAKLVKTQSKNAIIESLFFNLFDKYEVKFSNKASKLKSSKLQRIYKISIKDSTKLNAFLADIKENKFVEYAEKIPIYELFYTPNDLHPNQWYLPKINASQAWDLSVGVGSVVIAIVDDAVRLDHQDLAPNIWVNPNEIAGNGIDDDANGYIDDINGYDVADGDNNPTTTNAGKKHGTHCAGIAAAKSNNGTGIASISSNCKIMAVKCTRDAVISPSIPFAYEGLEYAIAAKPDVISLSWGGFGSSQTYQLLFDYAYSLGITVVAAAGNNYTDVPFYPASYNHVISVGATDSNDQITNFSNYGSTIDVMAPGLGIWSSVSSSNAAYENLSGTSMACPLVAGLCGLMKSYVPSATNAFIEGCLTSSAINIDALNFGYENQMGFGRIDAFRALSCMNGKPVVDFDSDKTTPCVSQQVTFFDKSIGNGITNYGWTFTGANIATSTLKDPVVSYPSPGTYSVTHSATNSKGISSITKTSYITIKSPSAAI
ncbi:MAG: hypothetical protein EAZ53_10610 [Bacteroidetes bacterium]|nr:MAG: hypothetical protein EAZ53_10610 [Bacteroidota bacterium]